MATTLSSRVSPGMPPGELGITDPALRVEGDHFVLDGSCGIN